MVPPRLGGARRSAAGLEAVGCSVRLLICSFLTARNGRRCLVWTGVLA